MRLQTMAETRAKGRSNLSSFHLPKEKEEIKEERRVLANLKAKLALFDRKEIIKVNKKGTRLLVGHPYQDDA